MNTKNLILTLIACSLQIFVLAQKEEQAIYKSKVFTIYPNRVEHSEFKSEVLSPTEMSSNYRSPEADRCNPTIQFKFSINSRDNEMVSGKDHSVTLQPEKGTCTTTVLFGKQYLNILPVAKGINLEPNTRWNIRLDMREVFQAFKEKGFYTLFNGDKLDQADFKGVFIAGNSAPLIWDFNNLHNHPELELKDPDGDHIYETSLVMNAKSNEKQTAANWKQVNNTSAFPQYQSEYLISDAIYNLALDEMMNAIEPDSTFRTGKEWAGVWTRDISYSIILSMAHLQPKVAKYSLLRKVKNGRMIQDTGTGGAYPVSTDRIIWAVAAWEVYKVTGDQDWLKQAYAIVKNSVEDDLKNAYNPETGLVRGESSFLDWREETYPRWMQPVDIYESENLGTNAVHYQANMVLSQMAKLLNDQSAAEKYGRIAANIKNGINANLWMSDKGYYGQYIYGRNFKSLSSRAEALGEALTVIFGIADEQQQKSVIANTPETDFGISCIYPQIPGIPPYHNNAVWPFVQSYWALASAKAGNEKSVLESIAAIYRPAALFLTNKENFVSDNGDFAGTQINSSNMLWSLSGNLSLVHKVLFGIDFHADSLVFHPFVPKALAGKRSLTNFKYRKSILNIELEGFGNEIKSFELDGKIAAMSAISSTLTGKHDIRIVLTNREFPESKINKVSNYTTLETPVVSYTGGNLSWKPIEGTKFYTILKNGKPIQQTTKTSLKVDPTDFAEYQVITVDANNIPSFASEPVVVVSKEFVQTIEFENFAPKSSYSYKNYQGDGFVEISKTVNRTIAIPVEISSSGTYAFNFRYANGNGPINTENKCAIRSLNIDGNFSGTIVLPQRGTNEWLNWGFTNAVQTNLTKGKHQISITFEPSNENMNGEINQAMLDVLQIYRIK
jgi:Bacterial alpha-L-rhamnosidase 6 hairpin glycosidase domain